MRIEQWFVGSCVDRDGKTVPIGASVLVRMPNGDTEVGRIVEHPTMRLVRTVHGGHGSYVLRVPRDRPARPGWGEVDAGVPLALEVVGVICKLSPEGIRLAEPLLCKGCPCCDRLKLKLAHQPPPAVDDYRAA